MTRRDQPAGSGQKAADHRVGDVTDNAAHAEVTQQKREPAAQDRGKRDGVKLGYVFAICDGNVVKGTVTVTEVDDQFCGGRAVMANEHKAAIGYKIRNDLSLY